MLATRLLVAAALVSSLPRAPCEHADLAGGPVRRARGGSLDVTRRVDVGVSTPELEAVYTLRDDVVDAVDDWMAEVTGVVPDKSSSGKPMHKLARRRRMVPGRGTEEVTQDTGLRKEKDVVEWLEDMIGVGEGGAEQRCMDPEVEPALQLSVPWCAWEDDTTVEANLEMVQPSGCVQTLPAPEAPRCQTSCGPGRMLAMTETGEAQCKLCPRGTFSVGGGDVWDSFARGIPPALESVCFSLDLEDHDSDDSSEWNSRQSWRRGVDCSPWSLDTSSHDNATSIVSGNNTGRDAIESYLVLQLSFVRPGSLWFRYTVDAEDDADGLIFRVDSDDQPLGPFGRDLVSQQPEPREVHVRVAPGWHTFKWIYFKDMSKTCLPATACADSARIHSIGYNGTAWADTWCRDCPRGTASEPGASRCSDCLPDTVFDSRSFSCVPCPTGQYALPGFTECRVRAPCTLEDIAPLFTPCAGGKRDKSYKWVVPKKCNDTLEGAMSLPSPETGLACEWCQPGSARNGNDGPCHLCAEGEYSPGHGVACSRCARGSQALRATFFATMDAFPPSFKTGCEGGCGSGGWRAMGPFLDPGIDHVGGATVWLEHETEGDGAGLWVTVDNGEPINLCGSRAQKRRGARRTDSARIEGIESVEELWSTAEVSDAGTLVVLPLSPGRHTIRWVFRVRPASGGVGPVGPAKNPYLTMVAVVGVLEGGAFSCTPCPAGWFSVGASSECRPCPEGHDSAPGGTACTPCPPDFFAPYPGTAKCEPCGEGTHSRGGMAECAEECQFELGERLDTSALGNDASQLVYDASALRDAVPMVGPLSVKVQQAWDATALDRDLFFSLCSPLPESAPCRASFDPESSRHSYACAVPIRELKEEVVSPLERGESSLALGTLLSAKALPAALKRKYKFGVSLEHSGGDGCSAPGGMLGAWSIWIHLVCAPDQPVGKPEVKQLAEDGDDGSGKPCQVHVVWASQRGCPLCQADHYVEMGSECSDGARNVTFHFRDPKGSPCFGGLPLPPPKHKISCLAEATGALPPGGIALLVAGAAGAVGGFAYLVFLFVKYRNMYLHYSILDMRDEPYDVNAE